MTVFTKSLGGSVAASGTLARRPMTVVGSITMSGVLTKVMTKAAFTGSMKATGYETPTVPGGGSQVVESGGNTLAVGGFLRGT